MQRPGTDLPLPTYLSRLLASPEGILKGDANTLRWATEPLRLIDIVSYKDTTKIFRPPSYSTAPYHHRPPVPVPLPHPIAKRPLSKGKDYAEPARPPKTHTGAAAAG